MSLPDETMKLKDGKIIYDQLASMVAVQYSEAESNPAGSYVIYNGSVYLLPNGHIANTSWANTEKEGPTNIGAEHRALKTEINSKTDELKSTLRDVIDNCFPIDMVAIPNKYIDQNNGKLLVYNGWTATDFIKCKGGDTLYITATKQSNYGAFYSSNDEATYLSRLPLAVGANTVSVPESAKYFRLSNTTADMLNTKILLTNASDIKELETQIDVVNAGEKNIGSYVLQEYVNNSTGAFESASSYKRTGYIPVSDYKDGIIYFRSNTRTPYCFFYASDYTPISAFLIFVGETFVTIPDNAAYCAYSYSRYNDALVTMYDPAYSALKALKISGIRDINLKYLERTDVITQLITKPMFLVYTDIHGYPDNFNRIEQFNANNLTGSVSCILCLGDMVRDQASDDITWMNTDFGKSTLKVIGNHDVLVDSMLPGITKLEAYNRYIAPGVSEWGVVQPTGAAENGYTYYYKDITNSTGDVRLIILDEYYYDQTQHEWFVATLADAKTNGYGVIVCQHQSNVWNNLASPLNDQWAFATPAMGFDLYRYDTGYSGSYANAAENRIMAVNDFIGNGGEFICWMSGHTHSDQCHTFEKSNGKQLSLVFSNAGMSMTSSMRVADYSCDCFQYVAVNRSKKYIYVARIGETVDKWFHKNEFMMYDYGSHNVIEYH